MKRFISNLNRKQRILLFVNVVLVILSLLVFVYAKSMVNDLYSQQGAKRWESKKDTYAQVSAFISPERGMQLVDVSNVRSSLMEILSADVLNEAEGDARVWIDSYSGESEVEVRKDGNTIRVTATGVGGDFFQFHPMQLLSGSYITSDDTNQDRIVIDNELAWVLFGSNDVVGMQVWLGDNIYVVAGVVAVEEESLEKIAYGNRSRIYIPYEQLQKNVENLKVTCYEAVLPNPISNYAYNALISAFGLDEVTEEPFQKEENPLNFDNVEVIENSNRYDMMTMVKNMKKLKLRSMRANAVVYPYWENIARVIEEWQMGLLIMRMVLLTVPCISLVCYIYSLYKRKTWTVKGIAVWIFDTVRERRLEIEEAAIETEDSVERKQL